MNIDVQQLQESLNKSVVTRQLAVVLGLSPFSLWEKGRGRGAELMIGASLKSLSPTLSRRERELKQQATK